MDKAINDLKSKSINVFDTSKFTVKGETLTTYKADVDTDANYEGDHEAISDGYFHESEYRSAPYFDIIIDGIEEISEDESGSSNSTIFHPTFKGKSKGLSGGTIAAIVVPIVGVIVALGVALAITTKGTAAAVAANTTANASMANSSINNAIKM